VFSSRRQTIGANLLATQQPEYEREEQGNQNAAGEGYIKADIALFEEKITRKVADPGYFTGEGDGDADERDDDADEDQGFADIMHE
jgi:hypothetical protein